MILIVFVSSLAWLLFLVSQAPHFLPKANNTQSESAVLYFPTNLEEVKKLTEKISQITETDLGKYQFSFKRKCLRLKLVSSVKI